MGMAIVAARSKIGTRNFTAFRAQANRCFLHAQMCNNEDTKQRWLSLGTTWLAFADRIEAKWPMAKSDPMYVAANQENVTWH